MKCLSRNIFQERVLSPSSRRAWIEILSALLLMSSSSSRPPRGGRGLKYSVKADIERRTAGRPPRGGRGLKYSDHFQPTTLRLSPSSRRAWIEISGGDVAGASVLGRPPRGGRGLKLPINANETVYHLSPSSRRAWIEILHCWTRQRGRSVALLAEGVD